MGFKDQVKLINGSKKKIEKAQMSENNSIALFFALKRNSISTYIFFSKYVKKHPNYIFCDTQNVAITMGSKHCLKISKGLKNKH